MKALVVLLSLLALALPAQAQNRVWRVGLLANGPPPSSNPTTTTWRGEVKRALEQGGFVLGRNLELVERYAAEHPVSYQQSFTRFRDEKFLSLLVVRLNPPMIVEDVRRLSFKDLPLLFVRLQATILAR